jgi:hypothetical protein
VISTVLGVCACVCDGACVCVCACAKVVITRICGGGRGGIVLGELQLVGEEGVAEERIDDTRHSSVGFEGRLRIVGGSSGLGRGARQRDDDVAVPVRGEPGGLRRWLAVDRQVVVLLLRTQHHRLDPYPGRVFDVATHRRAPLRVCVDGLLERCPDLLHLARPTEVAPWRR